MSKNLYASIDIGVGNLATVTLNSRGEESIAVSARQLKSINQFYNRRKAELQAQLPNHQHTSRQLNAMEDKRYLRVQDILHRASRYSVDELVKLKAGTLIIGKNDGWKQNVNMGKVNNQNFVCIPFLCPIY